MCLWLGSGAHLRSRGAWDSRNTHIEIKYAYSIRRNSMISAYIFTANAISVVFCSNPQTCDSNKIASDPTFFDDSEALGVHTSLVSVLPPCSGSERKPLFSSSQARSQAPLGGCFRGSYSKPNKTQSQKLKVKCPRLKAQGPRIEAQGSILKAQGSRHEAPGSKSKARAQGLKDQGRRPTSQGSTLKVQGSRLQATSSRLKAQGPRPEAQGSGLKAKGARPTSQGSRLEAQG